RCEGIIPPRTWRSFRPDPIAWIFIDSVESFRGSDVTAREVFILAAPGLRPVHFIEPAMSLE
ncbi:MAG TPA: hypothetical protein PL024_12550, partial [Thauera sp.]|nr:hypothetical protein [Thauera sp.]